MFGQLLDLLKNPLHQTLRGLRIIEGDIIGDSIEILNSQDGIPEGPYG